jgi:hypothetical protein
MVYFEEMGRASTARPLFVVTCVALSLLLALSLAGLHASSAILVPLLILFTLPVLRERLHREVAVRCQPVSFLSLDSSRAPPIV